GAPGREGDQVALSLTPGTKLGPYEIAGLLGSGGMGEVYRARDTRLGRDVAVKVLPRGMASDPERQQRFEAEARAAGSLNHPNIVTLHDVGVAEGVPYLVTEVLEGESLRALIERGPIPISRAVDLIVQLANGLTAAHGKGIVHRDLKPENLFVLSDGRLKILDFGIAKLTRTDSVSEAETTPVFASLTAAGTIMGTVSYMAPEQLRDRPVDQRADLFAVGAILHELLTGKQPFTGETAADRVSAILMADAPALPAEAEEEIPGIGAVVAHLLAKRPEGRFDSAADLAFTLKLLKGKPAAPAAGAIAAADRPPQAKHEFRQLTFRDGEIGNARFAPDGQTVVYDAGWGGGRSELYLTRLESPESSPLGIQHANVQAVSSTSEVAAVLRPVDLGGFIWVGTLARLPLVGGRPREIADSVYSADWTPDGRNLAAIRVVDGICQLEAPLGHVVHKTHAWMSHLRYSPDGSMLAFLEHPGTGNNAGYVCVIRPGEAPRRLTKRYEMVWRMAWRSDGKEIWFGAQEANEPTVGVAGVTLDGVVRNVFSAPGWAAIEDVARNGDALLAMTRPRMRMETGTRTGGLLGVRDLSNLDWTLLRDLSADGSTVLFDETGLGTAGIAGIYLRPTDGSPAVRLADGVCSALSSDGRYVLAGHGSEPHVLFVVPTGAGETRRIELPDYAISSAVWLPGTDSVVLVASKSNGPRLVYRADLATRAIEPIGEGISVTGSHVDVSDDGARIAVRDSGGIRIIEAKDGSSRHIPGLRPSLLAAGWTADSRAIFVWSRSVVPVPILRVDVDTGASEPWMDLWPMVRSGVAGLNSLKLTPDGERYACSYVMIDSTLFLARGLT
ncbi:MAG TPA: protein kinase, partial [Candidatus Eisenbacteria bacterium]|nr:protein kinase [Candidatus Eisenbacteria bacterium]